jgi:hypothetical protein
MVSDHVERLEKASCKIPCPYLKGATKPYKTSHESCTFQYLEAKKCQDILRRHPISINFSLWVVSDVVFLRLFQFTLDMSQDAMNSHAFFFMG